jgi:hypothetical protein
MSIHQSSIARDAYDQKPRFCSYHHCSKRIPYEKKRNIYCSHRCRALVNNPSREVTKKSRQKTADSILSFYQTEAGKAKKEANRQRNLQRLQERIESYNLKPSRCSVCCGAKSYSKRHNETCSWECRNAYLSKQFHNSNNRAIWGKRGWHNGIHCDSTWELAFVIYCEKQGLPVQRCRRGFPYVDANGQTRTYYPDFIVGDTYFEIKGRIDDLTSLKSKSVPENFYIFNGKELENLFRYVEIATGIKRKNFHTLYKKGDGELTEG